MAATGANGRATETQSEGSQITWGELYRILGYSTKGIDVNENIKDRDLIIFTNKVFANNDLTPLKKYKFSMRVLDRRASHNFGAFSRMLILVGNRAITAKQEEELVSKMFSIKGRNELLADVLGDLEKRPKFKSIKLRRLFGDSKYSSRIPAAKIYTTLANIPTIAAPEIPKAISRLVAAI
jgi:hypothetical protein